MAGVLSISINIPPAPEGFSGSINDVFEHINENATFDATGDFLTGQIGGAEPTENVGLWISNGTIYVWSETQAKYVPSTTVPVGGLISFVGTTAPENFVISQGQELIKADYPALYAIVGDVFKKASDSASNFRVPDLRGRTLFGAGEGDYNAKGDDVIIGKMKALTLGDYIGREWLLRESSVPNAPTSRSRIGESLLAKGGTSITSPRPCAVVANWLVKAK